MMASETTTSVTLEAEAVPLRKDSSGTIRVAKTRVTLDTLVGRFMAGASAEEIAEQFPALDIAEVYSAIGYYLKYKEDLDKYLEQRRVEAVKIRQEVEARFPTQGLRERLLARRKNRSDS